MALFGEQSRRLFVKYLILVVMFLIQMLVTFLLERAETLVGCKKDGAIGRAWRVQSIWGVFVFMTHVMPAMFCSAVPRAVFIKDAEQTFLKKYR